MRACWSDSSFCVGVISFWVAAWRSVHGLGLLQNGSQFLSAGRKKGRWSGEDLSQLSVGVWDSTTGNCLHEVGLPDCWFIQKSKGELALFEGA